MHLYWTSSRFEIQKYQSKHWFDRSATKVEEEYTSCSSSSRVIIGSLSLYLPIVFEYTCLQISWIFISTVFFFYFTGVIVLLHSCSSEKRLIEYAVSYPIRIWLSSSWSWGRLSSDAFPFDVRSLVYVMCWDNRDIMGHCWDRKYRVC